MRGMNRTDGAGFGDDDTATIYLYLLLGGACLTGLITVVIKLCQYVTRRNNEAIDQAENDAMNGYKPACRVENEIEIMQRNIGDCSGVVILDVDDVLIGDGPNSVETGSRIDTDHTIRFCCRCYPKYSLLNEKLMQEILDHVIVEKKRVFVCFVTSSLYSKRMMREMLTNHFGLPNSIEFAHFNRLALFEANREANRGAYRGVRFNWENKHVVIEKIVDNAQKIVDNAQKIVDNAQKIVDNVPQGKPVLFLDDQSDNIKHANSLGKSTLKAIQVDPNQNPNTTNQRKWEIDVGRWFSEKLGVRLKGYMPPYQPGIQQGTLR